MGIPSSIPGDFPFSNWKIAVLSSAKGFAFFDCSKLTKSNAPYFKYN